MLIENIYIPGVQGPQKIFIQGGIIQSVVPQEESRPDGNFSGRIFFENALAFPGLVNSHDHLDFNLFPQLGRETYNNYSEWGKDIHLKYQEIIRAVTRIPSALRIKWGIYKNLLNGVTTVVNHGKKIPVDETTGIINVLQDFSVLHSIKGEKYWKLKLNGWAAGEPVVIHIGEGTDRQAYGEIDALLKWNLFKKKLIGVHGVAMTERQAAFFHAVVWCPASNYFMFQRTADVNKLKHKTNILFGTDSTLTAPWNMWEHVRLARSTQMLDDRELFGILTTSASNIWMNKLPGDASNQNCADIVVAENKSGINDWNAFYNIGPEDILLVLSKGHIRLFDSSLYSRLRLANVALGNFSRVYINGTEKFVYGDLPQLMKQIRQVYPAADFPVLIP
jgi:hypothetical protein